VGVQLGHRLIDAAEVLAAGVAAVAAMTALGGGYQLTTVDLSSFPNV
jgi:hypothetical protein